MDPTFDPLLISPYQVDESQSRYPKDTASNMHSGSPNSTVQAVQPTTPTHAASTLQTSSPNSGKSARSDSRRSMRSVAPTADMAAYQSNMQGLMPGMMPGTIQPPFTGYPSRMYRTPPSQDLVTVDIEPTHMSKFTSVHGSLPQYMELCRAKAEAELAYATYHPGGGEVTNDIVRLGVFHRLDIDNLPRSKDLSKLPPNQKIETYFENSLVAEFYRQAARPAKPVGTRDPTIPTDGEVLKAHVKALIHAFNSWEFADDNPGMLNSFKKQSHDQKLVEVTCWGILKACIERSLSPQPLMSAWDKNKSREGVGHDSFAKRYDATLKAMAQSKTICKHLFDAPYVNVFIDDPTRAQTRVRANRDLNKQKAEHMVAGKRQFEAEGKLKSKKKARQTRDTTTKSESVEGTPTFTPNNASPEYHGNSPMVDPSSPLAMTAQQSTRRSARNVARPTSYATYPLMEPVPNGYSSPMRQGEGSEGEIEDVKPQTSTLSSASAPFLAGNLSSTAGPYAPTMHQQQMWDPHYAMNYPGMSGAHFGSQFGTGNGSQAMMYPQDAVRSSSGNRQWANPYAGSAYSPNYDAHGSRHDQGQADGAGQGEPN